MPKSLVLIVGAGASKEVNLPVGIELRSQIANALDIRYEDGHNQSSGDFAINYAFQEISRQRSLGFVDIKPFILASWRIRDAMPQAISIDNFIDSHRDDKDIAICGKLGITRCILAAEAGSSLYVNRRDPYPKIDFAAVESTWFNNFFQLLTENCQVTDIDDRLSKVAIVSFNYDRCIEHYLHGALQNYYGITSAQAAEALTHLQIFHPYGFVGPLPWQSSSGGIEYGAQIGGQTLIDAAKTIRTFTEGVDPTASDIELIRATLREAHRIVFLGFAFHRLNVALLFPSPLNITPEHNRRMFATGLGISQADGKEIAWELSKLGGVSYERIQLPNDLSCAGLFREYWRSLSLS